MARPYVKTVRKSGGRVYLYLVEPQIVDGKTVGHKVLRKLSEEEARSYGWKGDRTGSNGQNQTAGLPFDSNYGLNQTSHHTPILTPISVEQEPAQSSESTSILTTPEGALKAPPKQENSGESDQEEFKVVPRPRGFYVLEPQRPDLARGYVMVRTESDGVTNVFCGLCPGFTCVHVEFMKKWLQTR